MTDILENFDTERRHFNELYPNLYNDRMSKYFTVDEITKDFCNGLRDLRLMHFKHTITLS